MHEPVTRHQRRRERTRTDLQDAMLELMAEKGYEEIVVQDITDRADVGRGTFYFHYQSKAEILWSIVEERFSLILDAGDDFPDTPMSDQAAFNRYVDWLRDYHKHRQVFLAVMGSRGSQAIGSKVRQRMAERLAREMEQTQVYEKIGQPPEIAAQIVVGLVTHLAVWWLEHSPPLTAVQLGMILYQTLHHQAPPDGPWLEGDSE